MKFIVPTKANDKLLKLPTAVVDISGSFTEGAKNTGYCQIMNRQGDQKVKGEALTQNDVLDKVEHLARNHQLVVLTPLRGLEGSDGCGAVILRYRHQKVGTTAALDLRWFAGSGFSAGLAPAG